MARRVLVLLLHAHLPECRRPGVPDSLEETWLFEALAESYLPLVGLLDRLAADGIPVRLTLSLSPTLLGMLADRSLQERFLVRVDATAGLARADAAAAESEAARAAADWHAGFYTETGRMLRERCPAGLLPVFAAHAAAGRLELATTAATHAFLPAHQGSPGVVRAQVGVGIDAFASAFGGRPAFFWLPECAYHPGIEDTLASFGVRHVALESHGVVQARPPPPRAVRAPLRCPQGILAFGRDAGLSRLVWSAADGYPGHPDYREFHRDRVTALDDAGLRGWLGRSDRRPPSGLKYWRVTGPVEDKGWYDPAAAAARARAHARDFVARIGPEEGLYFAPFDAELFGHWWFEGPVWLEAVFRELERTRRGAVNGPGAAAAGHPAPEDPSAPIPLVAATVSEAAADPGLPAPEGRPAPSSWGESGDYSFWVNRENAWIYPRLDAAARRLATLLNRPSGQGRSVAPELEVRALRQAARTLLLAQSSDWPFLLRAGTARETAATALEDLTGRFTALCEAIESGSVPAGLLESCERLDPVFPGLDLGHFREPCGVRNRG